jgi:hypothetical protein
MNLCKLRDSLEAVTTISVVTGDSRVKREVTCAASGCRGSVDFE